MTLVKKKKWRIQSNSHAGIIHQERESRVTAKGLPLVFGQWHLKEPLPDHFKAADHFQSEVAQSCQTV